MKIEASNGVMNVGHQLDNLTTAISFPVQYVLNEYGSGGSWNVHIQRNGDVAAYPTNNFSVENGSLNLTLTASDMQKLGEGQIQLSYTIGSKVKMSRIYRFYSHYSLDASADVPEPWVSWVEAVEANADRAEVAVTHYPQIDIATGNWLVWDAVNEEWSDTGIHAQGEQGVPGPQGPQGQQGPQGERGLQGEKGDKGDTGATGPQGSSGPQGATGPKGDKGEKGDKGDKGDTGAAGPQGQQGEKGDKGDPGETIIKPYASLERKGAYIYDISFDTIPEFEESDEVIGGACTSFVRDGKLHRHLDWSYDNTAEFRVMCKDFTGMAFLSDIEDGGLEGKDDRIGQLPYHLNDGRNDAGIMITSHVLYNDFEFDGSGEKLTPIYTIPYIVLTQLRKIEDIHTILDTTLANLKIPSALGDYLLQFLVTDGETTYVITPSEDGYEIVDASDNPKLTNFKWVSDAIVDRTDLQLHPTGVERWNAIESSTLDELRYTVAYEAPTRLSEFIGINGTDKDSTDEELEAIYDLAHAEYLDRNRDGATWQTVHSVVYGLTGMEHLWVQEDWDKDYCSASVDAYTKAETDEKLSELQPKIDILLSTEDKYIVGAVNEVKETADSKSEVSVSGTGTSTIEGRYITIDGVEYMLVGSEGIPDAPNNGKTYIRKNGQWAFKQLVRLDESPRQNLLGDFDKRDYVSFDTEDGDTDTSTFDPHTILFGSDSESATKMLNGVKKLNGIFTRFTVLDEAPLTPTSNGLQSQVAFDNDYMYICKQDNQWVRVQLAEWEVL